MTLDSLPACEAEIKEINSTIHEFENEWSQAAGKLKKLLRQRERAVRFALIGLKDSDLSVSEKNARAEYALWASDDLRPIEEEIDRLEEQLEGFKTRFKAMDRRSSNVQTLVKIHTDRPGRFDG